MRDFFTRQLIEMYALIVDYANKYVRLKIIEASQVIRNKKLLLYKIRIKIFAGKVHQVGLLHL